MTKWHHQEVSAPQANSTPQFESPLDFFREDYQRRQAAVPVERNQAAAPGHSHSHINGRAEQPQRYRESREPQDFPAFGNIFGGGESQAVPSSRRERAQPYYQAREHSQPHGRNYYAQPANAPSEGFFGGFSGGFGGPQNGIARAAREAVGTSAYRPPEWSNFKHVPAKLGCASTVTGLVAKGLQEQGIDPRTIRNLHQVGIAGMEAAYRRNGMLEEIPASQAGSGDIVVGQRGRGRHGHTGVVINEGAGLSVVHNSGGVTREQPLQAVFGRMSQRYYRIRTPGNSYASL